MLPGLALSLAVAAAATALAHVLGLGSGPVIGIVLGLVVGTLLGPRARLRPGVRWSTGLPLRGAVVVLGAELPIGVVAAQGARSLPGIVITLGGCLAVAALLGRRLGIPRRLRTLVGVGTAICGASAIAAVTPVIDADETEVGYSVATIFLFNVLAVLLFPLLGHALGLGQRSFGVFAGTAVNDLSSVVATAGLYGGGALHTAVVVKLTRTLMIVPVCAALGRGPAASGGRRAVRVPPFLLAFGAMAALRGVGVFPAAWAGEISQVATLLITLALSAVGLSIDLGALQRAGLRPLVLGAVLWVTVSALSLGCQAVGLL
jgi:uncharacterized integral membrane protein (TIGR00698 family)